MLVLMLSSQTLKALEPFTPCGVDIGNQRLWIRQRLSSQRLGENEILLGATRIAAVPKVPAALAEANRVTADSRGKPCRLPGDGGELVHGGDAFEFEAIQRGGFDVGVDLGDPGPQGGQFGVKASPGTARGGGGGLRAGKTFSEFPVLVVIRRRRRPYGARGSPFARRSRLSVADSSSMAAVAARSPSAAASSRCRASVSCATRPSNSVRADLRASSRPS